IETELKLRSQSRRSFAFWISSSSSRPPSERYNCPRMKRQLVVTLPRHSSDSTMSGGSAAGGACANAASGASRRSRRQIAALVISSKLMGQAEEHVVDIRAAGPILVADIGEVSQSEARFPVLVEAIADAGLE